MNSQILFSASIFNFRLYWLLWPTLFLAIFLVIQVTKGTKLTQKEVKGAVKFFLIAQCLFLIGHLYSFVVELIPYHMGYYEIVEGDVEQYFLSKTPYTDTESFSIDGVEFHYSPYLITFGYNRTARSNGGIHEGMKKGRSV